MRIATLQFSPKLGRVDENIARADSLLASSSASLTNLDLLVLPELAFTGYNHPSFRAITPLLEPTASGPSTQWAARTAARLHCLVAVGYPELFSPSPPRPESLRPTMIDLGWGRETYYEVTAYNAVVVVDPDGKVVAHYRKTNLYYTDEVWAQEGPEGFQTVDLDFPVEDSASKAVINGGALSSGSTDAGRRRKEVVRTTFAICMDLNPHHFLPSSPDPDLPSHILSTDSQLLILSTAWLTHLSPSSLSTSPEQPDLDTLGCWLERLGPLIHDPEVERICVFANRCGAESGRVLPDVLMSEEGGKEEGEGVRYAGSSWIGVVGSGRVRLGRVMGSGEEGVCGVVDTEALLGEDGRGWEVVFREGGEWE
ncbi:MAG: hypothetical protein LQ338_001139 [Usnochroma carphineum]|nr:MAG: hypothetical protein LQ338_001139 [Usnochroma carphineum]